MRQSPSGNRPRNQRVSKPRQRKQQHLLDVKLRSQKATHYRNRRVLVTISKIALAVIVLCALYLGTRIALQRFIFENPDYTLATIDVQTDGTLQREQVLQAAGLRDGENIFRVNLARVHDALQGLPQVDEVQVIRKMPGEIDIRVVERKPVAWITSEKEIDDPFQSEHAFLIDARGILMKQKKMLPEYLGLPLITGVHDESLQAGKTAESLEAKSALELLRLSATSFMQTRFQIREIDASKGYCLVVTDKNHTRITFGFDRLEEQVRRLEQFLVYADDSKREIETVNLLVQRNIPVTFSKTAVDVINDTYDPDEVPMKEPRIMKAIPVHAVKPVTSPKPLAKTAATPKLRKIQPAAAATPVRSGLQPFSLRKSETKGN
ncbi:MAG: FtsQ-type POTRA domain-containing protein [Verrucomicrobiota bacterium]|nr:FtsQ-type POTRA domain-containing protein [Verrucomicrobiota bacterium]